MIAAEAKLKKKPGVRRHRIADDRTLIREKGNVYRGSCSAQSPSTGAMDLLSGPLDLSFDVNKVTWSFSPGKTHVYCTWWSFLGSWAMHDVDIVRPSRTQAPHSTLDRASTPRCQGHVCRMAGREFTAPCVREDVAFAVLSYKVCHDNERLGTKSTKGRIGR